MIPLSTPNGYAKIMIAIAIIVASFGAGWQVNGWRLNAKHAKEVAELTAQVSMWQGKVVEQNAATDLLHEKKVAADDRRKLAADMSKSVLSAIGSKSEKVAASTATDCEGVLKEAHEDAR